MTVYKNNLKERMFLCTMHLQGPNDNENRKYIVPYTNIDKVFAKYF